jgi:hypothetical protein
MAAAGAQLGIYEIPGKFHKGFAISEVVDLALAVDGFDNFIHCHNA